MKTINLCLALIAASLTACHQDAQMTASPEITSYNPTANQAEHILLNQIGYSPESIKIGLLTGVKAKYFELIDINTNTVAFSNTISNVEHWQDAGIDVQLLDFSAFTTKGKFVVRAGGVKSSQPIEIADRPFSQIHDAALKAYYFNRASTELTKDLAGQWARPTAHADTQVKIHSSAATEQRPEGYSISSPKGWYDAGDYNKYIVNSGISTYTLMLAYAENSAFYRSHNGRIPESNNDTPDILDEVLWNLEWMLSMQDPNDGGVYHKLTTLRFEGAKMPHAAVSQRYVVKKSTSATLNFAAVMAYASRIYSQFSGYEAMTEKAKQRAEKAWLWALQNPGLTYKNPTDVKTGEYDDEFLNDEFKWAAAELFLLTKDPKYFESYQSINSPLTVPSWSDAATLAHISLLNEGKALIPSSEYNVLQKELLDFANTIVQQHKTSVANVAMATPDYIWGSNAVAMNKAMVLLQATKYTKSPELYFEATRGLLDYVLGKNPTGFSYVTGHGYKTPMDIHHRQSYADDVEAPVPGFLAGGPHPGRQDGCEYPSPLPASNYADTWCSYSTNEVTINWNAPLVYVTATLTNLE